METRFDGQVSTLLYDMRITLICMLQGFKDFISRGNAVDLAIGVAIGAVFAEVIDSIVTGLIDPIIGFVLPGSVNNLASKTLDIGDLSLGLGLIASTLITFIATAAAIYFFVVVPMNKLHERRSRGEEADAEPTNEEKIVLLLEKIANKTD